MQQVLLGTLSGCACSLWLEVAYASRFILFSFSFPHFLNKHNFFVCLNFSDPVLVLDQYTINLEYVAKFLGFF